MVQKIHGKASDGSLLLKALFGPQKVDMLGRGDV